MCKHNGDTMQITWKMFWFFIGSSNIYYSHNLIFLSGYNLYFILSYASECGYNAVRHIIEAIDCVV
jgi:hypothetical protein